MFVEVPVSSMKTRRVPRMRGDEPGGAGLRRIALPQSCTNVTSDFFGLHNLRVVCTENLNSDVVMVKPAEDRV